MTIAATTVVAFLCGCSPTGQPQAILPASNVVGNAPASRAAGFLGKDSALLQPAKEGHGALVYVNPTAKWSSYDKVMIEPVEFWDTEDSKVSPRDQHMLTAYLYDQLKNHLEKDFTVVDQGGLGVIVVQAALIGGQGAEPGLRSVSIYVPMARATNGVGSLANESKGFMDSAKADLKVTDSQTGVLLAASVIKREGGSTTEAQSAWGNTRQGLDYWAEQISERLYRLQAGAVSRRTS